MFHITSFPGSVSGVAVGSAIFQSLLDRELSKRITGPDASDVSHASTP